MIYLFIIWLLFLLPWVEDFIQGYEGSYPKFLMGICITIILATLLF